MYKKYKNQKSHLLNEPNILIYEGLKKPFFLASVVVESTFWTLTCESPWIDSVLMKKINYKNGSTPEWVSESSLFYHHFNHIEGCLAGEARKVLLPVGAWDGVFFSSSRGMQPLCPSSFFNKTDVGLNVHNVVTLTESSKCNWYH